jgi:4-diphosphocytidyl-2-C-methyl-D-erythritol kinase
VKLPSINVPSFAKINRSLKVLGKRQDGFHEIVTVFQTISLFDELTFVLREDPDLAISCNDPEIPVDKHNLVWRAAERLRQVSGVQLGASINLIKRIPAQAGLGGGSSNAAITLLALNELWSTNLSPSELFTVAATLGSDVPFFLIGGTCLGEGTGNRISPLPDGPVEHLIVITPQVGVSTAAAYNALNAPSLTTKGSTSILARSFAAPTGEKPGQWALENDFERVIFEIEPEIKRVKLALLEAGARGALLAGSGSSVFGIFSNEEARAQAVADLKSETGWRLFSCNTLPRDEYIRTLQSVGHPLLRSLNLQPDTGA